MASVWTSGCVSAPVLSLLLQKSQKFPHIWRDCLSSLWSHNWPFVWLQFEHLRLFLGKLCAAHCSPFLWPHYWCEKTVEFQACRSHFLHFPHVAKVALPVCVLCLMQRREHTHRCDQHQYRVMDVTMSDSRIDYQIVKSWGIWCLKTLSWWLYSELYDKILNRIPILHCFPQSTSLSLSLSLSLPVSRYLFLSLLTACDSTDGSTKSHTGWHSLSLSHLHTENVFVNI